MDNINPSHYIDNPYGFQPIEITRWLGFNLGNALKYLWRWKQKNGVEDIKKALWYIKDEKENHTFNTKDLWSQDKVLKKIEYVIEITNDIALANFLVGIRHYPENISEQKTRLQSLIIILEGAIKHHETGNQSKTSTSQS